MNNWEIKKIPFELILKPKPQNVFIEIEHCNYDKSELVCLTLSLINTSNTYTMVTYSSAKAYGNTDSDTVEWKNSKVNQTNEKVYLRSGEMGVINFYCQKEQILYLLKGRIELVLILENGLGDRYQEKLELYVLSVDLSNFENFYVNLHPQKYKIGKFNKITKELIFELENDYN